jgi:hypothetical protein
MQDFNALANALLAALGQQTNAGISQMGVQRRNTFEDFNNRAAKRGTLYSTGGGAQRSRYDATTYVPGKAQLQGNQLQQEIKVKGDILTTQRKIDAMNKAATELNGIDDNYFKSLLV